jgi:spoIIIJ-associated protein
MEMRFEAKSEADAVERAAQALDCSIAEVKYHVVRDEKSFWGGRIVEIEVEAPAAGDSQETAAAVVQTSLDQPPAALERETERGASRAPGARRGEPVLDEEAFAAVESTLSELLSAAGFLLETRRRTSREEMVIELIGDDVEPLLANKGEGLNGLEVLTGRIASRRLGRPVYPRIDAEGFRDHQRESLEELAHRSADEVKRTRRPTLLPPLSPGERRLVHLALAEDPDVETESEGDGFLKRVAVKLKAR